MPVTLEQVANAAGVSIPSASRALHGTYLVENSTKQRVLQAAENLCSRPNIVARSLRTEQTYTIGIVVDDIVSPFSPLSLEVSRTTCRSMPTLVSSSMLIAIPILRQVPSTI
jgi:LacI family transcriptional regulator